MLKQIIAGAVGAVLMLGLQGAYEEMESAIGYKLVDGMGELGVNEKGQGRLYLRSPDKKDVVLTSSSLMMFEKGSIKTILDKEGLVFYGNSPDKPRIILDANKARIVLLDNSGNIKRIIE
ncbi:MAG: hypothetical protein IGS03_02140 [Candidatus Sericytochromatia bacterium]|nr:hypothetical protein [Candidatus Sericytochromatia bacterium]